MHLNAWIAAAVAGASQLTAAIPTGKLFAV